MKYYLLCLLSCCLFAIGLGTQTARAQSIVSISADSVSAGSAMTVTVIGSGTTFTAANNVYLSQSSQSTLGARKVANLTILSDSELNFTVPCDVPQGYHFVLADTNGLAGTSIWGLWPDPSADSVYIKPPTAGSGCNQIKGYFFKDANSNCVRDSGEVAVKFANLTVTSTTPGFVTQNITTDANGYYQTSVGLGTFTISSNMVSGGNCYDSFVWICPSNPTHSFDVTFAQADNDSTYNFGIKPATNFISGVVYYDLNGNCQQDSTEFGVPYPGIKVTPLSPPGSAFMIFGNAQGQYNKSCIDLNTYKVELVLQNQSTSCSQSSYNVVCPSNANHDYTLTYSQLGETNIANFGVNNVACNNLSLFIYKDLNQNCLRELNESNFNIHGIRVDITPTNPTGPVKSYWTNNGKINAWMPDGSYKVNVRLNNTSGNQCGTTYYDFNCPNDTVFNIDFTQSNVTEFDTLQVGLQEAIGSDLKVVVYTDVARSGFSNHHANIYIYNYSSLPSSPTTVSFTYTTMFNLINSSVPFIANPNDSTYVFNVPSVNPGSNNYYLIALTYEVPAFNAVLLHTYKPYTAEVFDTLLGACLNNNIMRGQTILGNAWDPNDKTLLEPLVVQDSIVTPELSKRWRYQIRCQNTGNDTCFTIVIRDTLSDAFDTQTLRTDAASHDYVFELFDGKYATWTFNNVLLVDSLTNEPKSHAFVQYSIDTKANLPLGTRIENTAGIYFDYNPVVITNTTQHRIDNPTAIDETLDASQLLRVYPNPATDLLNIDIDGARMNEISLFDALGRVVRQQNGAGQSRTAIAVSDLPAGFYMIQVQTDKGKALRRVVIGE